jgi:hypothetical protein
MSTQNMSTFEWLQAKREWSVANDAAIRILHKAWMETSGDRFSEDASKRLAHAKNYLLCLTWDKVSQ